MSKVGLEKKEIASGDGGGYGRQQMSGNGGNWSGGGSGVVDGDDDWRQWVVSVEVVMGDG